MAQSNQYFFSLPDTGQPDPFPIPEEYHPDYQWLRANRTRSRKKHPINAVEAIIVHATAGYATQHAVDAWRANKASAHWIIPDEDEPQHGQFFWATVPESLAAYHVRDDKSHRDLGSRKRVNDWSLGIELVNTQNVKNFTDPFSDWQLRMTALIVRYAWSKYPNLKYVASHAKLDPRRRSDPGSNFPWDKFQDLVLRSDIEPPRNMLIAKSRDLPPLPKGHLGGCCP